MSEAVRIARNKGIVRALGDAMNAHDAVAASAFFAEDATNHGIKVGRAGIVAVLRDIWFTFPDNHAEVQKVFAADDWVAEHLRVNGTHLGVPRIPHHGDLRQIEPTGKAVEFQEVHFWRLRDGLIIEHEAVRDDLTLHRQLGHMPTPA